MKFLTSQSVYSQISPLPQVAVVGRSNVGKSSLLNMLAGARIARTSSEPGRTRLINYFDFGQFLLVDLPGYGYAKASKADQQKWASMIEGYFRESKLIKHVLLLLDMRHAPSERDMQMLQFLYFHNLPFTVIGTKADKLSRSQTSAALDMLARHTSLGKDNIIVSSATAKLGRAEITRRLAEVLQD